MSHTKENSRETDKNVWELSTHKLLNLVFSLKPKETYRMDLNSTVHKKSFILPF
jgi:hypothetical protein